MLRIHFTLEDLTSIQIAASADLGAETLMSLHMLAAGGNDVRFQRWRRAMRQKWNPSIPLLGELGTTTMLPGFLTLDIEPEGQATAATGAQAAREFRRDYLLGDLARHRVLTPFARHLADDDRRARKLYGRAIGSYQAIAVDPFRPQINGLIQAEHTEAVRIAATGIGRLLGDLHPLIRWRSPILEADLRMAGDIDLHLDGRGLLLQPTVFGAGGPVIAGYNIPGVRPSLIYPIRRQVPLGAHEPGSVHGLIRLLGTTRTAVLSAIADAGLHSTGDIARHVGCSPAAVSHHTAVLRDSGLILTSRDGLAVHHAVTDLGITLLGASR